MEIKKFIKKNQNQYIIIIDDNEYTLYDDIILEYNLLSKKIINEDELNNVIEANNNLESYYKAIKYINKKMRSTKEVKDYLKKEYDYKTINKTIDKLIKNKFIDDERYLKCFINDQIHLTDNGINKIKAKLLSLDFNYDDVVNLLDSIDNEVWIKKVDNFIEKKIKLNKSDGPYIIKYKIKMDLINKGYTDIIIDDELIKYDFYSEDAYKKAYTTIKNKLEKKYTGRELEMHIKKKMYEKGFRYES